MIAGGAPEDEGAREAVLDHTDGLPALGQTRPAGLGVSAMCGSCSRAAAPLLDLAAGLTH